MKRILFILITALGLVLTGCRNKTLCDLPHFRTRELEVIFHWDPADEPTKPVDGSMRGNFFAVTPGKLNEIWDFPSVDRDTVELGVDIEYSGISYDYNTARQVFFRKENDPLQIEAVCVPLVRASYTKDHPEQAGKTYGEAPYPFYVATTNQAPNYYPMGSFTVPDLPDFSYTIHFYPHNVAKMYTFRIMGDENGAPISGVQYITNSRGGVSGMSASYFLATGLLASDPSTIFFNASVDLVNGWIVGKFATFGPLTDNEFIIEAQVPTNQEYTNMWTAAEVTPQVTSALCLNDITNPDIILWWPIVIIPTAPEEPGDMEFDVDPWGPDITVPLNAPARFTSKHSTVTCPNCGVSYLQEKHIPIYSHEH